MDLSFFNLQVFKKVFNEFFWPKPYLIIDQEPDILVEFQGATIEISDNGEGGVIVEFKKIGDKVIRMRYGEIFEVANLNPQTLDLEEISSQIPNKEDTERIIRNHLKILNYFFTSILTGEEPEWLDSALNYYDNL